MRITKIFTFDVGHRLSDYDGKCRNLHGHTYILEVTLEGKVDDVGFVMDFDILKLRVNQILNKYYDHKTILKEDDPFNKKIAKILPQNYNSFYMVKFNPTVENIVKDIYHKMKHFFGDIVLYKLRLYETPSSYAEITQKDA